MFVAIVKKYENLKAGKQHRKKEKIRRVSCWIKEDGHFDLFVFLVAAPCFA